MPFSLHIPLPGPFSYSRRIGGRGGGRTAGRVLFWLAIGWWLIPSWWILLGLWWLVLLCYGLVRGDRRLPRWPGSPRR